MIIGKIIGGLLGYSMGGILPALLGLFVGHLFDRGYRIAQMGGTPEQRRRIQNAFFETVFKTLGHIAKADGHVSEEEVRTIHGAYGVDRGASPRGDRSV